MAKLISMVMVALVVVAAFAPAAYTMVSLA
jgi:hypothetical protein